MVRRVPILAVALGVAGLAPFILLGLLALGPEVLQARRMTLLLVAYGAVILSFLGAVHWGLALAQQDVVAPHGERARFLLGVAPALIGWVALALPLIDLPSWSGLLVLIAGFLATILVEHRATRLGLVPPSYTWLRGGLTLVVLAMLVTVVTLHILGQSVLF